jgi:hypothetical protein
MYAPMAPINIVGMGAPVSLVKIQKSANQTGRAT